MKTYLRDSYQTLAEQHRLKLQSEKERERLEDDMRLARARASIDDDKEKKLQVRTEFNQAQQELIRYRQMMKEIDKKQDDEKKENYKRMCDDNERKLKERDEQYKAYYLKYGQNLDNR